MAKRKQVQIYRYNCTITDEEFKTTRKAPSPEDLISVNAYYELHPEEDDRPEHIKKGTSAVVPMPPSSES